MEERFRKIVTVKRNKQSNEILDEEGNPIEFEDSEDDEFEQEDVV